MKKGKGIGLFNFGDGVAFPKRGLCGLLGPRKFYQLDSARLTYDCSLSGIETHRHPGDSELPDSIQIEHPPH
jgi:hypothetical protein